MKKVLYLVLSVLFIGITISSCQKEYNEKPNDLSSKTAFSESIQKTSNYRKFYWTKIPWVSTPSDWGADMYYIEEVGCAGINGNCLPDIIIHGLTAEYEKFKEAVSLETVDTYFINNDYKKLFPDLGFYPNVIADLKNGNSEIVMKKNEHLNDGLIYYIVCPKDSIFEMMKFENAYQVVLPVREY